jgi:hypothetical protein
MKKENATEKDAQISTKAQAAPASNAEKSSEAGKELTDADCAAVVGSAGTHYRPGNN